MTLCRSCFFGLFSAMDPNDRPNHFELRTWPDGQQGWYCLLCNKWWTEGHNQSTRHVYRSQNPADYLGQPPSPFNFQQQPQPQVPPSSSNRSPPGLANFPDSDMIDLMAQNIATLQEQVHVLQQEVPRMKAREDELRASLIVNQGSLRQKALEDKLAALTELMEKNGWSIND